MAKGKGIVCDELSIAIVCKEMGWDYYTYMRQPSWLVRALNIMRAVETEEQRIKKEIDGVNSNRN